MEHIQALDEALVEANLERLSFYYGRTDGWVPLEHYERMLKRFPTADVTLCPPEIPHAFVLGHSDAVAQLVAASLRKRLSIGLGTLDPQDDDATLALPSASVPSLVRARPTTRSIAAAAATHRAYSSS